MMPALITIDAGTPDDVAELARELHPADAAELEAGGVGVAQALSGAELTALRCGGRLLALFGCGAAPGHPDVGVPWMLSTRAIEAAPRRGVANAARTVVAQWRERFAAMANCVHAPHTRARRFVAWLGFTIDPEPVDAAGRFLLFHWER